jgi:hypothetical protein
MLAVGAAAGTVRERRAPAAPDNPFLAMERAFADTVERSFDMWRDMRDAWTEIAFHAVYGGLAALGVASDPVEEAQAMARAEADTGIETPEMRAALAHIAHGGYAEAVVRMMILLAKARGGVRRTRLARSSALMQSEAPFAQMSASARQALIREQTLAVELDAEGALAALPKLLPTPEDRSRALSTVEGVAGPEAELGEAAQAMLARIRAVLAGD